VQDEHRFRKLDRVYRSIGAAGIVFDDLQHAGTTEPLEHLCCVILIAYLLVSRLPVWSGKSETSRIRRDLVLPMILGVVLYVALLMSFTWEVLSLTVLGYILSLPFGARFWHRRYGTLTIGEEAPEKGLSEIDRGL